MKQNIWIFVSEKPNTINLSFVPTFFLNFTIYIFYYLITQINSLNKWYKYTFHVIIHSIEINYLNKVLICHNELLFNKYNTITIAIITFLNKLLRKTIYYLFVWRIFIYFNMKLYWYTNTFFMMVITSDNFRYWFLASVYTEVYRFIFPP